MVVLEVHFFGKWVHINHNRGDLGSVQTTFLVFLVFFSISNKPPAYLTELCFEQVQWRKQWDAGSRGSLLKKTTTQAFMRNEYAENCRHAAQGSTGVMTLAWKEDDYSLLSADLFPLSVSLESTSERQTIPFSSTGRAEGLSPHCFIWTAMSKR